MHEQKRNENDLARCSPQGEWTGEIALCPLHILAKDRQDTLKTMFLYPSEDKIELLFIHCIWTFYKMFLFYFILFSFKER